MRSAVLLSTLAAFAVPACGKAQVFEVGGDGTLRQVTGAPSAAAKPAPAGGLQAAVTAAAARYDLAPALIDAVAYQESRYRASAVSPKGAIGVMQLMPGTARALRVDPRDPVANINGGAAYLRQLVDRFDGRIDLALAAYNAGPGAVARHDGVPPYSETQAYVASALGRLAKTSFTPTVAPITGEQP